MRVFNGIVAIGLIAGLSSCKKEKIEILETNSPVFHLQGTFDGSGVELTAGDDGVFMHTYSEISNGVNVFSGSIGTSNEFISVGIYNGNIDFNELFLEDVLGSITPQFSIYNEVSYTVNATDFIESGAVEEVKWFLNGMYKGVNSFTISDPGMYELCAEVRFADQTTETLCNEIIAGYAVHAVSNSSISSQSGYVNAQIQEDGIAISKVNWFVDGQSVGSGNSLYHFIGDETKTLRADIVYANGIQRSKSFLVNGYQVSKNVLDFSSIEEQSTTYYQDYRVLITYMKDGVEYRSDLADNSSSTIAVNGFEYYGENASGKDVYKLDVSVAANLSTWGNSSVHPIQFNAVFGIEIE